MITVAKLMTQNVITAENSTPISTIINRMVNNKIGSIILTDEGDFLTGIFTESDLLRLLHQHLMDENIDWLWSTPIKKVMSKQSN